MLTPNQLKTLLILGVASWAIVLVIQGQHVSVHMLTPFSYVLTVLSIGVLLWEKWLWSWWVCRGWLNKRPDLRGTWKGTVNSDWVDPDTKLGRGGIDVYLVIRQTYSTIDVRLYSEESSSVSLSGHIFSDSVEVWSLAVVYRNTPRILKRGRSPINHGGLLLSLVGAPVGILSAPVHKLDGEYWTDRNTKGEITFGLHRKTVVHDFEEAVKVKFSSRK
jgi:hypothetical protein